MASLERPRSEINLAVDPPSLLPVTWNVRGCEREIRGRGSRLSRGKKNIYGPSESQSSIKHNPFAWEKGSRIVR